MNPKKQARVAELTREAVAAGRARRFEEADAALRKALRIDPHAAGALLASAVLAWRRDHDAERALKLANRARVQAPREPTIHLRRGELLAALGRRDEAGEAAEMVLALAPQMVGAYMLLHNLGRLTFDAAERLASLAASVTAKPEDRRRAHYLLGTLFERGGRYAEAFDRYTAANRCVPPTRNAGAVVERLQRTVAVQRRLRLPSLEPAPDMPRPIFIVGMPRSGSTLVEQVLTATDDVTSVGESAALLRSAHQHLDGFIGAVCAESAATIDVPRSALAAFRDAYLCQLLATAQRAGAGHVVDKQLEHFALVPLLRAAFPEAAIIHTRRHPLDVGISCFATPFERVPYTHCLLDIAAYYRHYEAAMALWAAAPELAPVDLVYERLVADPAVEVPRLVESAGLTFDACHLHPERSANAVSTASIGQVRSAFSTGSVGRWRRFETQLQPLIDGLGGMAQLAEWAEEPLGKRHAA